MKDEYHSPLSGQFLDNVSSSSLASRKGNSLSPPSSSPSPSTSPSLSTSPSSSTFPFSSSLSSSLHSTDSFVTAAQRFWDGLCCGEPLTPLLAAFRQGTGVASPPHSSSSHADRKNTSSFLSPTASQEKTVPKRPPCTPGDAGVPPSLIGNPTLPSTHPISFLVQAALLLSVEDASANADATAFFLASPEIRAMMLHHWKHACSQKYAVEEREQRTSAPLLQPSAVHAIQPKKDLPPVSPPPKGMRRPTVHEGEGVTSSVVPRCSPSSPLMVSSLAPFIRLSFLLDPMSLSQTVRAELRRATSTPHREFPSSSSPSSLASSSSTTTENTERMTARQLEALQWLREAPVTAVTAATQIDISRRIGAWKIALESLAAIPPEDWTEVDVAGTVQALYLAGQACWRDSLAMAAEGATTCGSLSSTANPQTKEEEEDARTKRSDDTNRTTVVVDGERKKNGDSDGVGKAQPATALSPPAEVCPMGAEVSNTQARENVPPSTCFPVGEWQEAPPMPPRRSGTMEGSTRLSAEAAFFGVLPPTENNDREREDDDDEEEEDAQKAEGKARPAASRCTAASHPARTPPWTASTANGIGHASSSSPLSEGSHASHLRFLSRTARRVVALASHVIPTWSSPAMLHHVLRLYGYTPSLWQEACRLFEQALGLHDGHRSALGNPRMTDMSASPSRTPPLHLFPGPIHSSSPCPSPHEGEAHESDAAKPIIVSAVEGENSIQNTKEEEEEEEWDGNMEGGAGHASLSSRPLPSHPPSSHTHPSSERCPPHARPSSLWWSPSEIPPYRAASCGEDVHRTPPSSVSPSLPWGSSSTTAPEGGTALSGAASLLLRPVPSLWTILTDDEKPMETSGGLPRSTPDDGDVFGCRPLQGVRPNTLTLFHALQVLQPHFSQEWERGLRYTTQLLHAPYHVPIAHDVATVELILRCCIQGHRRTEALYYMALCNASRHPQGVGRTAVSDAIGIRRTPKASEGVSLSKISMRKTNGYASGVSSATGHKKKRRAESTSSIVRELRFPLQEPLARLLCERTPEMETATRETTTIRREVTEEDTKNEHSHLPPPPLSHLLSAADVYVCPQSRDCRFSSSTPEMVKESPKEKGIPQEWPSTASYLSAEELSKHFSRHTLFRAYNGLLQKSTSLEEAEWYRKTLFSIRGGIENESLAHLVPLYAKRGKWEAALHSLQELIYHPRRQARFLPTAALHDSVQYALEQAPSPGPSWEVSMKLFKDMIENAQVPLSEVAFQSVVKKCFSQGASVSAQKLFEYMIRHGVR